MIKRKVGERMAFSGGAEDTPIVEVNRFHCPGSLNSGDLNLKISQDQISVRALNHGVVFLSLETMKAIIEWVEKDS